MGLSDFGLVGRTAMVTGGATGLGHAMAVALTEAGADVVGVYNRTPPDGVRGAIEALGRRFHPLQADLADTEQAKTLLPRALEVVDRVDILVNNAGITRRAALLEFTEADWDQVLNVNLKSLFLLSQAVARHMVERGIQGKMIHVASMLSFQGGIRVPSYTASKHGVMGLTRLMANELAAQGINVNAIAPGYMATENTRALREDPTRRREILGRIPAGRWGEADDLNGATLFLASRASDYVHGITLPVDRGWLNR